MKLIIIFFALSMSMSAAGQVDNVGFYSTRDQQIFKIEDKRDFKGGYVKGDDVPYFSWEGLISGKKFYFHVHGPELMLSVGGEVTKRFFRSAPALPGVDPWFPPVDNKGADLYIKSAKDPRQSLICIQTLGPDSYRRPRPYWEVYLITDPLSAPRLYRISGINADCGGLERAYDGTLLAPVWRVERDATPEVEVRYYALNENRFRETHIRFTGTIQSAYADKYFISEAP